MGDETLCRDQGLQENYTRAPVLHVRLGGQKLSLNSEDPKVCVLLNLQGARTYPAFLVKWLKDMFLKETH